jgi:quercetin dioxygenase-like cupin family protein
MIKGNRKPSPPVSSQSRQKLKRAKPKTPSRLGPIVRRLRRSAGLSVRQFGRATGFSASFISQVERGLVSPSIASLELIAGKLGVGFIELFREMEPVGPLVVKVGERHVMDSAWSHATLEAIGSIGGNRRVEVLGVTLLPGGASGKHLHRTAADLLCIVLAGEVCLMLEDKEHRLRSGDSARIPSNTPHRWQNSSKKLARLIKISCPLFP